ncbi:unnamed protein product [Brachionus calyciflorus]|uniref:Shisa N-terminal domain-containing protein n=1 Tax=Brachionus calyciflorus TaxID=104777 RepID=A0A813M022_9BILA|nr:unnamed protein product [Brachionus calyciflorus]
MRLFIISLLLTIYIQEIRSDSCTVYSITTESYHVEPCIVPGSFCCGGCSNRYCCALPEKKLEQSVCSSLKEEESKPVVKPIESAPVTAAPASSSWITFHTPFQSVLLFLLGLLITLILLCCIPLMCCLCCRDCFRVCGFGGRNNNANVSSTTYGNGFSDQMRKRFDNFFGTSSYNTSTNQNVANTSTTNYVSVAQDDFTASQNTFKTNNQANTIEYHEFSEIKRTYN